jgi:ABC-type multidrug transport system fused ATPase/permease subunit
LLAYVYAALAFLSTLLRSEVDLQHLWFCRRASVRTRSELMAIIYDKALKRKDLSGAVDKKNDDDKKKDDKQDNKPAESEEGEKKADIGKIVNLMSADAGRISNTLAAWYLLFCAPIEIVVASVFLFKLLGWSGFVGFVALILAWPINSYLMKRALVIYKDVSTARDERMSILNELITAVKFIKFFAWGV